MIHSFIFDFILNVKAEVSYEFLLFIDDSSNAGGTRAIPGCDGRCEQSYCAATKCEKHYYLIRKKKPHTI